MHGHRLLRQQRLHQWPAFDDSAEALTRLAGHYDLVVLSNVDRAGLAASGRRLGAAFTAVITAEDVGAYKPADPPFEALHSWLDAAGHPRSRLLHVAQSLFHDHVPARRHGLDSVWIDRRHAEPGWGATPEPDGEWTWLAQYPSMAAFADAVDAAFDAVDGGDG